MHRLETVVIAALDELGIQAHTDPAAVGVWAHRRGSGREDLSGIGVRIRKGVSLHGIALNVTTHLTAYDVIVPCGLDGRAVTSIERTSERAR